MRVLTLIDAFRMGGAETLLAPLANACRSTDLEMEIVGLSPESVNSDKTITVLRDAGLSPRSLNVRRLLDPTAVPQLVRAIRASRCDVVHAHLEMAMSLGVPAAAIAGKPAVCTFHHVARPLDGRAAKRERVAVEAASRSQRAIFVSTASMRSFGDVYRPAPNWCVVNNGIDLSHFVPGPADPSVRAELGGGGPGATLVVLPAAFRAFKGLPLAVAAWPKVLERFPGAVLSLVGGGEMEPELRRQVADAGLQDAVRFAGVRTDMPQVYRAADVVLVPSTSGENFPTTVIEASGSERPIVASRAGGIPDIVLDGRTGLLFDEGDVGALAAAVCDMLGDERRRTELAGSALARARAEFSAQAWLGNLREVYEDALGQRARRRKLLGVGGR